MKRIPTILLIEDEVDIAELMKDYLESNKYKVLVAATRNEAFFKINNQKFDCIISDISLRQSDVTPVLKELKTNQLGLNYKVPVIIHSGNVTGVILKQNKDLIKAVFVKPSSTQDIVKSLQSLIVE